APRSIGNGHQHRVFYMRFAARGKELVSVGRDSTARVWEAATGKELRRIGDGEDRFFHVAISQDGRWLATGRADDESITLHDLQTGKEVRQMTRQQIGVVALGFSADAKMLASITAQDGVICLWDVATDKLVREFNQQPANNNNAPAAAPIPIDISLTSVSFSPDGKTVVSISEPNMISVWDVATGKQVNKIPTQGQQEGPYRVVFAPDNKTLVTSAQDNTVCLWSVDTGKLLRKFAQQGVVTREG